MEKEDLVSLHKKVSVLKAEGKYKEAIEACHQLLEGSLKLNAHPFMLAAHAYTAASYYSMGANGRSLCKQ